MATEYVSTEPAYLSILPELAAYALTREISQFLIGEVAGFITCMFVTDPDVFAEQIESA